jgi:hypothetical protein
MVDASRSRRSVGSEPTLGVPAAAGIAAGPEGGAAPLTVHVLGPLRVWRDGVEVDTGPRQQTHLLALLLMRAGRPVSGC